MERFQIDTVYLPDCLQTEDPKAIITVGDHFSKILGAYIIKNKNDDNKIIFA